jgi:hypothetical protein
VTYSDGAVELFDVRDKSAEAQTSASMAERKGVVEALFVVPAVR